MVASLNKKQHEGPGKPGLMGTPDFTTNDVSVRSPTVGSAPAFTGAVGKGKGEAPSG